MKLKSRMARTVQQWPMTRWFWRKLDALSNLSTRGLSQEQLKIMNKGILDLLNSIKNGSVVPCRINGISMQLPVEILRMFPQALHPQKFVPLNLLIETLHTNWICSRLAPGDVALDIGASIGIVATSLSHAVGPDGKVFSFEPSRGAATMLRQVIELNHLENVTPVTEAVAAQVGKMQFLEFLPTEGDLSWIAETSTLTTQPDSSGRKHSSYDVPVTTIDHFVQETSCVPRVIKIDIEGFELDALQGGEETLASRHPAVSVDIHIDPRTGVSTFLAVKEFFERLGYRTAMSEHVLLAEHAKASA